VKSFSDDIVSNFDVLSRRADVFAFLLLKFLSV